MNNDDGVKTWQTIKWKGINNKLEERLNACIKNGLIITCISYAPTSYCGTGAFWYVAVKKKGSTDSRCWFQVEGTARDVLNDTAFISEKISLGYMNHSCSLVAITDTNGYKSRNVPENVLKRIEEVRNQCLKIDYIILLKDDGYFIKDGLGCAWRWGLNEHLENQVKETKNIIYCVAVSNDCRTWIVVYDRSFKLSTGNDAVLKTEITSFLKAQNQRTDSRKLEIKKYEEETAKKAAKADQEKEDIKDNMKGVQDRVIVLETELKDLKVLIEKYKKGYENALLEQIENVENLELQEKAIKLNLRAKRRGLQNALSIMPQNKNLQAKLKEMGEFIETKHDIVDDTSVAEEQPVE